ncbi:MAG TPA: cobalt ECF transporter T component CbiQ [Candidatus Limnocylindrales bacterium]
MDLDRHVPRDSPIHAFDPRLKLVFVVAGIVGIALLPMGAYAVYAAIWVVLVTLSAVARLGAWRLVRGSVIVLPFALVALPLIFTRPGDPVFVIDVGPFQLTATREGLRDATSIVVKSWLSVQAALLLAYTTPFPTLLASLRALRLPALLVSIIGFMYRYLAVIGDEAARLDRARSARAVGKGIGGIAGLRWRARVAGGMVGSLFIRSYERSERVHAAMLSRGFTGTPPAMAMARPSTGQLFAFALGLAGIAIVVLGASAWGPRW